MFKNKVYVGLTTPHPTPFIKKIKTSLMYIFWLCILFINDITQGGGGVRQNMTLDDTGDGEGVQNGPNLGDVIYEQP